MKRIYEKSMAYFVTAVTNKRNPVFTNEKYVDMLLITIEYFKLFLD